MEHALATIESQLNRWQDAGVLDAETAERIRQFEANREKTGTQSERPGAIEAVIYLGVAVVGVGALVLIATNWGTLNAATQIGVPAVSGLLAFLIGRSMLRSNGPQLVRGGQVAWLLSLALFATAWVIAADNAGMEGESTLLVGGLAVLAVGAVLWAWSPASSQMVGIAAGSVLTAAGLAAVAGTEHYGGTIFGLSLVFMAALGLALSERGLLGPRAAGQLLSCLLILIGASLGSMLPGPVGVETIGFASGAALVALSIRLGVFAYMGFGVATLFLALLTLVLRRVDDPTEAGLALTGVGLALLAGILLLARWRPWARGAGEQPSASA
jgi:hypothetical protein